MEIILKEDIVGLGYKNDIITVKNGYGRNYLIPTGKAVIATPSAKKVLAEDLRQQAHKIEQRKIEAEKRAKTLEGIVVEIAARVSATGVLYGSVNAAMVAEELNKKGIDIDKKIVTMKDAKHVGEYEAVVHFHKEVEVKVPVTVTAENAAELAAEEAARNGISLEEQSKAEEVAEVKEEAGEVTETAETASVAE